MRLTRQLTANEQRALDCISMAVVANTTTLQPFDTETHRGSVGPRWATWVHMFENYTTAMNITGDARL